MKKNTLEKVLIFVGLFFIFAMDKGGQACLFVPLEHNSITELDFLNYSSIFFMILGFTIIYFTSKISALINKILRKNDG